MNKKSSAKTPMLIGMILGFISLFKMYYTVYEPSIGDPAYARYIISIYAGIGGGLIGLILGYFVYSMFTPRKKSSPLKSQNRNQYNNNTSKTDELIRLSGLKNTGAISDIEFRKLKSEILNRR